MPRCRRKSRKAWNFTSWRKSATRRCLRAPWPGPRPQRAARVLITGGYHTQAIGQLARQGGCGVINIRPRQVRLDADTADVYFELLHNPDRPTAFEELLARAPLGASAIAVQNYVAAHANVLAEAFATGQAALNFLKGKTTALAGSITRMDASTVRVKIKGLKNLSS